MHPFGGFSRGSDWASTISTSSTLMLRSARLMQSSSDRRIFARSSCRCRWPWDSAEQELERLINAGRLAGGNGKPPRLRTRTWVGGWPNIPDEGVVALDVHHGREVVTGGWNGISGRFLRRSCRDVVRRRRRLPGRRGSQRRQNEPPGFAMLAEAISAVEEPVIDRGVSGSLRLVTLLRLGSEPQMSGVVSAAR